MLAIIEGIKCLTLPQLSTIKIREQEVTWKEKVQLYSFMLALDHLHTQAMLVILFLHFLKLHTKSSSIAQFPRAMSMRTALPAKKNSMRAHRGLDTQLQKHYCRV